MEKLEPSLYVVEDCVVRGLGVRVHVELEVEVAV